MTDVAAALIRAIDEERKGAIEAFMAMKVRAMRFEAALRRIAGGGCRVMHIDAAGPSGPCTCAKCYAASALGVA